MKKRISILDVARTAGVSKSTVSRVLNGESASEYARSAVRQAIEKTNYHPNVMARGLRGVKTRVVGIVTVNCNAFLENHISQRFAGMNEILLQAGYSMLLINSDIDSDISPLQNGLRFLQENRIDGLICIGQPDESDDLQKIQEFREVVYTGERINQSKGFRVYLGNYNYSRDLYQYLFSNGHRKILTLVGQYTGRALRVRREDAYQDICRLYGSAFDEASFFNYAAYASARRDQLQGILQAFHDGGYTAIFADNDELAYQIEAFFSEKGLLNAQDYSIVTIYRSGKAVEESEITGIELSDYRYGEVCARLILDVIENPALEYQDVVIPYQFHIQNSVKNID